MLKDILLGLYLITMNGLLVTLKDLVWSMLILIILIEYQKNLIMNFQNI